MRPATDLAALHRRPHDRRRPAAPGLLKNSERRAEHAIKRKLGAIATALLQQQGGNKSKAHKQLRPVIGMEEDT